MLLRCLLPLVLLFSATATEPEFTAPEHFQAWSAHHNKLYTSEEHQARARHAFEASLLRVEALNARQRADGKKAFGITKFADLTPEEFRARHLGLRVPETLPEVTHQAPRHSETSTPTDFDWRSQSVITEVKDQGSCGCCWAFSGVEAIETAWAIAGNTLTEFSTQEIIDCNTVGEGCKGGYPATVYDYTKATTSGLASEAEYPYQDIDATTTDLGIFSCAASQDSSAGAENLKGYYYSYPSSTTSSSPETCDNTKLAQAVSSNGAPTILIHAEGWSDYTSTEAVVTGSELGCSYLFSKADHAVQLVGYSGLNTDSGYWIVRNQWGESWGNSGYIYLSMDGNTCGLCNAVQQPFFSKSNGTTKSDDYYYYYYNFSYSFEENAAASPSRTPPPSTARPLAKIHIPTCAVGLNCTISWSTSNHSIIYWDVYVKPGRDNYALLAVSVGPCNRNCSTVWTPKTSGNWSIKVADYKHPKLYAEVGPFYVMSHGLISKRQHRDRVLSSKATTVIDEAIPQPNAYSHGITTVEAIVAVGSVIAILVVVAAFVLPKKSSTGSGQADADADEEDLQYY